MSSIRNKLSKLKKGKTRSIIILLSSVLMFVFFTSLVLSVNRITIYDEETVYSRYTVYQSPEAILEDENIEIGKDDVYEFTGFDDNNEGTITISRAFDVSVNADGKTTKLVMTSGTVQDALDKAKITLGEDDLVNVATDVLLTDSTEVVVNRVTYETYTEDETIPYKTANPELNNLSNANVFVKVEGKNGNLQTTFKNTLIDGEVVETEQLGEKITAEPVDKVLDATTTLYVGARPQQYAYDEVPVKLDANGIPVNYAYKISGKASAYSALGKPTKLTPGAVAMDLSKFPRGTKLYIRTPDGSYIYGYSSVRDTGTAVCDGRVLVDCFFYDYDETCRFGIKYVDVYVLN